MRRFFIVLFILMFPAPVIFAAEAQGVLRPVDLRCEYRTNPLGVDTPAPRLSWKLEAANPGARGLGQFAYQVLVASSEALLMRHQGDLWDSGKVNADRSTQVPYGGKPLSSGEVVWWKVRVWDNDANASPWSESARWSMGLLAESDWKAKWIGLEGGEGKPQETSSVLPLAFRMVPEEDRQGVTDALIRKIEDKDKASCDRAPRRTMADASAFRQWPPRRRLPNRRAADLSELGLHGHSRSDNHLGTLEWRYR